MEISARSAGFCRSEGVAEELRIVLALVEMGGFGGRGGLGWRILGCVGASRWSRGRTRVIGREAGRWD